jgi:hypothetical protein
MRRGEISAPFCCAHCGTADCETIENVFDAIPGERWNPGLIAPVFLPSDDLPSSGTLIDECTFAAKRHRT